MKSLTKFVINIGLMILLAIAGIWVIMALLKVYTNHNDAVVVPDIKGMTIEEAQTLLASQDLILNVTDSVYSSTHPRGVILEFTPGGGAKIKRHRSVYATINTFQIAQKRIPKISEVSMRQAEALLRSSGFTNISIAYVSGPYNDLALRVTDASGRELKEGTLVAYNSKLILEVSSNNINSLYNEDAMLAPEDSLGTGEDEAQIDEDFL
ncbi:PASTA domain-containing protein [Porphyromonas sp. COT-108 OH1349]|uniref:PASTA domain-containing protein n=1 Tax=Porphyromonas sp. COT-108 OH1349 TaxID=1537504 RepID=UPI000690BCBE|nr:PASTA domain-containing protein [Porphyromonas sp. COT-108 OH1349]